MTDLTKFLDEMQAIGEKTAAMAKESGLFPGTVINNWDKLIQINRVLLSAVDRIEDRTPSIGRPSFSDWELRTIAREALDKCKEIVEGK